MNDELMHYGTPHNGYIPHSGRYKYGSGDNPYQREDSFLRAYKEAHAAGISDKEFYTDRGMTSSEFRAKLSTENAEYMAWNIAQARRLKAKGCSNVYIAEQLLGDKKKENTVRNWLKQGDKRKNQKINNIAARLEQEIKEKGCVDVGAGVERELGVSREKLNAALQQLKDKGFNVGTLAIEYTTNPNNRQKQTVMYLADKGITKKDLYDDLSKVQTVKAYTPDGGSSFWVPEKPSSVSSKRVYVNYESPEDGTVMIRPGVKDLTLGKASFAQVRIAVDGTHYIKGMAIYSNRIPEGYDIAINSNKKAGTPLLDPDPDIKQVLKPLKADPDNPFGATIKAQGQRHYIDKDGKEKLSPVNIIREEADWDKYSKTLSAQFLAKQDLPLIKQQLRQTFKENKEEYDAIMRLTNPTVKKKLLEEFAESCDGAAVDLKATALPRQSTKVLLPLTSIKPNECYAPGYRDGEHVVLIRYPYAGVFESPELIVNNRNKAGKEIIGKTGVDAIGIHPDTAKTMSGADFDGDTAMVIPVNDKVKIKATALTKPLEALKGFDTDYYAYDKQVPVTKIDKKTGEAKTTYNYYYNGKKFTPMDDGPQKQREMGIVSNLITDMTIQNAPPEEIARAVKYSMVVIDAPKHKLDYKTCYKETNIKALKDKYQHHEDGTHGASTLISRAKAEMRVPERVQGYKYIDPETGEEKIKKAWKPDPETGKWPTVETGRYYTDRNGKEHQALTKDHSMNLVEDARELSTGTDKENEYASYANSMKALANKARKEALAIGPIQVSPSAKQVYAPEIESLNNKVDRALRNAPKERKANMIAGQIARAKIDADPDLDKEHQKRIRQQEMTRARAMLGANKKDVMVDITPREWEAIQAHAISTSKLEQILNNTDMDKVRQYATPRESSNKLNKTTVTSIERMLATGNYTLAEIAEEAGVSVSTVAKINRNEYKLD